jgi:hypothetical protein
LFSQCDQAHAHAAGGARDGDACHDGASCREN